MTDYAISLLSQSVSRYQQPQFCRSSSFDQITEQLVEVFFGQDRYFYKHTALLSKKPSALNQQVIAFFSPGGQFAQQIVKNQAFAVPMFTTFLTEQSVFAHTIYQGSVANSQFGKFIQMLVSAAINARFSVKYDCFELKSYRNCVSVLLEKWMAADLVALNTNKLAALCTGAETRRILFLNSQEYVPVVALQTLFNDLPKNQFQSCVCQNQGVETAAGDECAGFTAQLFCSNNNTVMELCLRSLSNKSEGGRYYLNQAAFYLLIQMSKFRHISKLPTFLQIIKNMNYAIRQDACANVFALFYEQISVFLESYLNKLRKTYAVNASGKRKFADKTNYYFNNHAMLYASLDQILIFCRRWRLAFDYEYFSKCYAAKTELLRAVQPFMQLLENSSLAELFKQLQSSGSLEDYTEARILQSVAKVQYRCGQLFDYRITQVRCNFDGELYRQFSNHQQFHAAQISAIVQLLHCKSVDQQDGGAEAKPTINLFGVQEIQYATLNKIITTVTPEVRRALYSQEAEYLNRLTQSGIQQRPNLSQALRIRISSLPESAQVLFDALNSKLFWALILIAGVAIALVKRTTLWLLS